MSGSQATAGTREKFVTRRVTASARPALQASPSPASPPASHSGSPLGGDAFQRSLAAPASSSSGPRAAGASALPAAVPALGEMDYYQRRIADFKRRHPDLPVPTYYSRYASKYIDRFTYEIGPTLSPAGQAWVARARKNLQVAMEKKRAADPAAFDRLERNDEAFRQFAFSTHPAAYLDAGLGKLPLSDLIKIGAGPDLEDILNPAGLEQVETTAVQVAESKAEDFGARLARDGHELVASAEAAF